jgi:hypothetical protein
MLAHHAPLGHEPPRGWAAAAWPAGGGGGRGEDGSARALGGAGVPQFDVPGLPCIGLSAPTATAGPSASPAGPIPGGPPPPTPRRSDGSGDADGGGSSSGSIPPPVSGGGSPVATGAAAPAAPAGPLFRSDYRGVSYDKKKRKWRVQIKVAALGKSGVSVGYFETEAAAARAYDRAAIGLLGRNSCRTILNFAMEEYDADDVPQLVGEY